MADLFLKERKQQCCLASQAQLVPPSKGSAEKSCWDLLSVLARGSKGAAQHFPTPVIRQGERAWAVPGLPVLVLPLLAAGGNRAQGCYRKTAMLGIGSPGEEPGVGNGIIRKRARFVPRWGGGAGWWGCAVCSLPGISRCWSRVYLRQNIPLFLPFPRQPFLLGAQCQGVPQ